MEPLEQFLSWIFSRKQFCIMKSDTKTRSATLNLTLRSTPCHEFLQGHDDGLEIHSVPWNLAQGFTPRHEPWLRDALCVKKPENVTGSSCSLKDHSFHTKKHMDIRNEMYEIRKTWNMSTITNFIHRRDFKRRDAQKLEYLQAYSKKWYQLDRKNRVPDGFD